MSIQRTCQNCQKEYIAKRPDQNIKFCCQKCFAEYAANNKTKHVCRQCNKEFIPKGSCYRFCSRSCSAKFNNVGRAKNGYTTKNRTKKAICITCSKETEININASIKTAKCEKCKPKIVKPVKIIKIVKPKIIKPTKIIKPMVCRICGSVKGQCLYPDICKRHRFIPTLIKLGLDETSVGSTRFYDEYFKIKEQITKEYLADKMSTSDIQNKYNLNNFKTVCNCLKYFNIKARLGISNNSSQFKSGYHISWFGQEFQYRSSYELKYAKQLDETKTMYQMEPFKVKYFDSTLNKIRVAVPDFYLPETNTIVEIKSNYTMELSGGIQNIKDRFEAYKEQGYNHILQLDFKEIIL